MEDSGVKDCSAVDYKVVSRPPRMAASRGGVCAIRDCSVERQKQKESHHH
jgi:hypothetical protein